MRTIKKRRRREGKTDYKARLIMLKSEKPRVIFRKTNKYIIGQLVKSKEAQDYVVIGIDSHELIKYGWPKESKDIKSLPAAYLTGFLLGKKIIDKEGKTNGIFDIGLLRNVAKSKIYGFLKGVIDAGVEINCDKKIFPDDAQIMGRHLKQGIQFEKIKLEIEKNG